jgi:hypothetical protein
MNRRRTPLTEPEETEVRLREDSHLSFPQIGRPLEVTHTRVRQIYAAAKLKRRDFAQRGLDSVWFLPARARRVAQGCHFHSRAAVRAAITSGRLRWHRGMSGIFWKGVMLRSASHRTWAALHAWAGRPPLPPRSRH